MQGLGGVQGLGPSTLWEPQGLGPPSSLRVCDSMAWGPISRPDAPGQQQRRQAAIPQQIWWDRQSLCGCGCNIAVFMCVLDCRQARELTKVQQTGVGQQTCGPGEAGGLRLLKAKIY